jgi:hypothetical protein
LNTPTSFNQIWIAKNPSDTLTSCTFTFTNSLITAQTVAPSAYVFVLNGTAILSQIVPVYLVNISSALSSDVYSFITDSAAPITAANISSLQYQITQVNSSSYQKVIYLKFFANGTN